MNAAGAKNSQQFAFRSRIELARKIAGPTNLLALNAAIEAQSFTKKCVLLGASWCSSCLGGSHFLVD